MYKFKLGQTAFKMLEQPPASQKWVLRAVIGEDEMGYGEGSTREEAMDKASIVTLHLFDPVGKSLAANIVHPDAGQIAKLARDIEAVKPEDIAAARGQMPMNPAILPPGAMPGMPMPGMPMPGMPYGYPPPMYGAPYGAPPMYAPYGLPPGGMPPPYGAPAPGPFGAPGPPPPRPPPGLPPPAVPSRLPAPPGAAAGLPPPPGAAAGLPQPPGAPPQTPAAAPAVAPGAAAAAPAAESVAVLVFAGEEDMSMEELRAMSPKYKR